MKPRHVDIEEGPGRSRLFPYQGGETMEEKKLTEKQRRFIDYYLQTGNAAEAARRAGYSEKAARYIGYENLTKPYILAGVRARLADMSGERLAECREILETLTAAMRGQLTEEVTLWEGIGHGKRRAVKLRKPISIRDQLKAAELLMRVYGLDRSDLEQEEIQARTEAIKARARRGKAPGEPVIIVDDTERTEK